MKNVLVGNRIISIQGKDLNNTLRYWSGQTRDLPKWLIQFSGFMLLTYVLRQGLVRTRRYRDKIIVYGIAEDGRYTI